MLAMLGKKRLKLENRIDPSNTKICKTEVDSSHLKNYLEKMVREFKNTFILGAFNKRSDFERVPHVWTKYASPNFTRVYKSLNVQGKIVYKLFLKRKIIKYNNTAEHVFKMGILASKHRAANCVGMSCALLYRLYLEKNPEIKRMEIVLGKKYRCKKFDHAFAVINRKEDSILGDASTWGESCLIADLWYEDGIVFSANEFDLNMKNILIFALEQSKFLKDTPSAWKVDYTLEDITDLKLYTRLNAVCNINLKDYVVLNDLEKMLEYEDLPEGLTPLMMDTSKKKHVLIFSNCLKELEAKSRSKEIPEKSLNQNSLRCCVI